MPRKQLDPIHGVVEYFESAPVDAAKMALEVVGAIVRRRIGKPVPTAAPKKPTTRAPRAAAPIGGGSGPGPVSTVGG